MIAPAAYLREFAGQYPATMHHVAAQRVLRDRVPEFFLEEQRLGAMIVVDNGVFDLGAALSPADLVRAARTVHAAEIILPDVMHDGPATMRASDLAAAQILRVTDEFRPLCRGARRRRRGMAPLLRPFRLAAHTPGLSRSRPLAARNPAMGCRETAPP